MGESHRRGFHVLTPSAFHAVYGPQNVTSGASSDLRQATSTANAMVKVTSPSIYHPLEVGLNGTPKSFGVILRKSGQCTTATGRRA